MKVVLQNRDRVGPFWQSIQDHIYELVMDSDQHSGFLVERAVTGLLRVAIRLLRREDIAPQVSNYIVKQVIYLTFLTTIT